MASSDSHGLPAGQDSKAHIVVMPKNERKGSKTDGMRIAFKELSYSVPSNIQKGKMAVLLKSVSGTFEPGEMAALMGPSGSGKTTLLDVLAGRKTQGKIDGHLQFGGERPTSAFLKRYTGYVEQFDTLIPSLTVYEMLLYTAELKRSRKEPLASKQEAVEGVLAKLALNTCRDVPIGSSMARGISGGQSKRTNIGIALITNPRVLFLDEPTSGLDSHTSNGVMTAVKALAQDGVTICATIHSPSAYCFGLFDRLLVLVRGSLVYSGSTGPAMVDFMQQVAPPKVQALIGQDTYSNDAEWMMEVVTEADEAGLHEQLACAYQQSALKRRTDALIDSYIAPASGKGEGGKAVSDSSSHSGSSDGADGVPKMQAMRATVTPWWWGLKTLLKYRTAKNFRDSAFLGPRIADKLIMALLVLTLYLNVGRKDPSTPAGANNLINLSAVLFMWCVLPAFGAAAYVPSIVLDRGLFVRERNDGLYRTITYLLAQMVEELLLAFCTSIPICLMVFYAIGLSGQWVTFWLSYYVTLCNGIAVAYLVAALSPNMDVANAALPVYVTMLLFFGGQLIRFEDMPSWWSWFATIDFVKYAWGTMMVNQFESQDVQYISGTILETFGFKGVNKWAYMAYQAIFFFAYFSAAIIIMSVKKYQAR